MQQEHKLSEGIEQFLHRFNGQEGHEEERQGAEDDELEEIDVYFVRRPKKGEEDTEQIIVITSQQRPRRTIPVASFIALAVNVLVFLSVLIFSILPELTANVTITLIPVEKQVSLTASFIAVSGIPTSGQIHARLLPSSTLTQSQTALATGKGHQNAKTATGNLTFYNASFASQTITAGTLFTGADGVHVATNETVTIPPNNPPQDGQASIASHAIQPGSKGNIQTLDINSMFSSTLYVQNLAAFTGGQDSRDYHIVTQADIATTAATLTRVVTDSMRGALQGQLQATETLQVLPCTPTVTADQVPGDEAQSVTVTVSETCNAIAYDTQELTVRATQLLTNQATKKLGTGYSLYGDVHISQTRATITAANKTPIVLSFSCMGTWVYLVDEKHITALIAGKPREEAIHILSTMQGVRSVSIAGIADNTPLPNDAQHIHFLVVIGL